MRSRWSKLIVGYGVTSVFLCGLIASLAQHNPVGALGWLFATLVWSLLILQQLRLASVRSVLERITGKPIALLSPSTISVLERFYTDLKAKELVYFPDLIERKVATKEDLSFALEKLVSTAHVICGATGTELALFDREAKQYHSSITLGRPFRESIDEYLLNPSRSAGQNIVLETIAFAGTVLGSLRVLLPENRVLSDSERSSVRLLSTYASMALVNADFVAELLRMRRLADDSVKAKTGFLASLSHELRAPLGVVLNSAELMNEGLTGPLSDNQKEMVEMILRQGSHLLDLLNDVLDYAKLESGKMTPQGVALNIYELLLDASSVIMSQALSKKINVTVVENVDELFVLSDRRHLRQILINLSTNAVKYTRDSGSIELKAEAIKGGKVKIQVIDSGVGIEPTDFQKVFSAFERIEKGYAGKQSGTGLGLALTKKLVEINGGTIGFESVVGKGSTFWFILPQSDISRAENEEQRKIETHQGKGLGVVFLGENNDETKVVRQFLASRGFSLKEAFDRRSLHDALEGDSSSVVVADESAREVVGGDFADLVRTIGQGNYHPIIFLSGKAFSFDVEDELRGGVDRYITKPYVLNDLAKLILDLHKAESRLRRKAEGNNRETVH